jgi:HlyD family secretion protein
MSILCAIPFAAALFSACAAGPDVLAVGYVEGDYVLLAPTEVGQVSEVRVQRGQRVEKGDVLARMDSTAAEIAVAQAEAALAEAEAQLANLQEGKRPEEIAVMEASVASAQAQELEARRVHERTLDLFRRGTATQAELDRVNTQVELASARLEEARAQLAVGALPGRPHEITAATKRVEQLKATLEQTRWRLSEQQIRASAVGRINDVIRNAGDVAGPSAPVLSLLPDGAVRLKIYVPEPLFSSVPAGTELNVYCNGCPDNLRARVTYVSPEPEFTPPVIFSRETRQKLVFLVEARPEGENAEWLQPGQIVDVSLTRSGD